MNDVQRLSKLLRAETLLKQTRAGYVDSPDGPYWRTGMPLLWEVRQSLGSTDDGKRLAEAHGLLKRTEKGYDPRARRWKRAMLLIDRVETELARPKVPALGPILEGGKPLLLESLTHDTDGLYERTGSHYPAFDFGWAAGRTIVAPEPWRVTRQSSAQGADAFYASGASGLKYWLGHIDASPATGVRFATGERVARIAAIPGTDHAHLGIDARDVIGRDLRWGRNGDGPDYTWGAPTIGAQLRRELER